MSNTGNASPSLKTNYLRLYKAADEILKAPGNPCGFEQLDGVATCVMSRLGWTPHGTLCCHGCEHHSPEGCTVQALSCKLGWCYVQGNAIVGMKRDDHPMFIAIAELQREARALGVPMQWRASVEQTFA